MKHLGAAEAHLPAAEFRRFYEKGGMAAVEAEVARRFPRPNRLQTLHDQANAAPSAIPHQPKPKTAAPKKVQTRSAGEVMLEAQMLEAGLVFVAEYKFAADRKWRLDFAFPEAKLAIEVQGGVHRIKSRFKSDIEKFNRLTLEGWDFLLFETEHIKKGLALPLIRQMLAAKEAMQ